MEQTALDLLLQIVANSLEGSELPTLESLEPNQSILVFKPGEITPYLIRKDKIVFPGEPITTINGLTDTPSSKLGQAGKVILVSQDETTHEYKFLSEVQGITAQSIIEALTYTPADDSEVVKSISANGGVPQTPDVSGNIDLTVSVESAEVHTEVTYTWNTGNSQIFTVVDSAKATDVYVQGNRLIKGVGEEWNVNTATGVEVLIPLADGDKVAIVSSATAVQGGSGLGELATGVIQLNNTTGKIYGDDAELTGDLTIDDGSSILGGAALIYHNDSVSPQIITGLTKQLIPYDASYVSNESNLIAIFKIGLNKIGVSYSQLSQSIDPTPPVYLATYPKAVNVAESTMSVEVQLDETGTSYLVVVPDLSAAPTSQEVKDGTAAGAIATSSTAVPTAGVTATMNVTGLSEGTAYDIYVVSEDSELSLQPAPVKLDVTTASADVTAPTIVSAVIENTTPTELDVVFSENVTIINLTGLTITGTNAPAINSVTGTGTSALKFILASPIIEGDVWTFNAGASNTIKDTASTPNALASTTQAITNNVTSAYSYLLDEYAGGAGAWSLNQLKSTYAGSSIKVRKAGGVTTQDIGFVGGVLDTQSMETFLAGSDGFVQTIYDQTGVNHFEQLTEALQPKIATAGVTILKSGQPAIDFSASYMTNAGAVGTWKFLHDGTNSMIGMVASVAKLATPERTLIYGLLGTDGASTNNKGFSMYWDNRASKAALNAVTTVASLASSGNLAINYQSSTIIVPNTQQLIINIMDADNPTALDRNKLYVDNNAVLQGNATTISPTLLNESFQLQLGALGNNVLPFTGTFQELVIFNTDQAANVTGIKNQINTRYTIY